MKARISCIAGIVLILFATTLYAASEDRIAAVVNADVITLFELETALQPIMKRIGEIPEEEKRKEVTKQARTAVMNQLIERLLIEQEAAKLKIAVTDEEVDKILEELLKSKGVSLEEFRKTLAAEGETLDTYKDELRRDRTRRKLIDRTVRSRVSVGEEEIGAYYAKHRDEYEGKAATRIQQILIVKPAGTEGKAIQAVRAKAEDILKKLNAGESFDLLVSIHSQGPAAGSGGDLGFVEKGMMFPAVDEAAFSLEKGEISNVIESPVGFHIIKIIDRRGAGIKPIEEVREEILGQIGNEKMKKKFEEWLQELKERSFIEIRL